MSPSLPVVIGPVVSRLANMHGQPRQRRTTLIGIGVIALTIVLAAVMLAIQHPWSDKPPHHPLKTTSHARP